VVKDEDTMAVDDLLGQVEVDWMDCFNNPSNHSKKQHIKNNYKKQLIFTIINLSFLKHKKPIFIINN
jgi:hypothetical protein